MILSPNKGIARIGMMRRMRGSHLHFDPEISPALQGRAAFGLLSDEEKGMLNYALQNEAKVQNCKVSDLQWKFGKGSPKRPLCIRKREVIKI